MKFLSLSILALVIALPASSVCGEVEIPQELQDFLRHKDELVKELEGLNSDIRKIQNAHSTMKCDRGDDVKNGTVTVERLHFGQVAPIVSKRPIKEMIGCRRTITTRPMSNDAGFTL